MGMETEGGMLLGRQAPPVERYAPELLYPIPRARGRSALGCEREQPFYGVDLWHAYEVSWLDEAGKPLARVGRFRFSCSTPNMVESKSFKLYLNSLNNTRFAGEEELRGTVTGDLAKVAGGAVELELFDPEDRRLAGAQLRGYCLDTLTIRPIEGEPTAEMVVSDPANIVEERLYSHLLRSLCPVTGQPDWASVWVHYRGGALDRGSLLQYITAYRQHQEFHEQCVERMFCDLHRRINPEFLHVQAFYTRRGGLDINPFRSTDPLAEPLPRLNRQ